MARITLDYPDDIYTFSTSMTVRTGELNHGNHLGFDQLVSLIGHARFLFLDEHGIDELDDPAIIVGDLAAVYRAEAFRKDALRFDVGLADPNPYGGDMVYRITRPADSTLIAMAKTGVVFVDHATKRPTRPPAAFTEAFRAQA